MYQAFEIGGEVTETIINNEAHTFIGGIRENQGTLWVWAESAGVFYEYTSGDAGVTWAREFIYASGRLQGAENLPGLNSIRMIFLTTGTGDFNNVHYYRRTFESPVSGP